VVYPELSYVNTVHSKESSVDLNSFEICNIDFGNVYTKLDECGIA
jgi:hypothetical protein